MARTITIGTRGSRLALVQAHRVAALLKAKNPECAFAVHPLATSGDRVSNWAQVRDETGIFVRELQSALREGTIDLAVHCVKDMPSADAGGLVLAAVPERADPRDVLISKSGRTLDELPAGAVVGTSSIRRTAQLLRRRPELAVTELRGNVDTRIRKLREGAIDATVLAAAGIIRLGMRECITEYLPLEWMLPAPCQGALGIELREDDTDMRAMAEGLNDLAAFTCVTAERAFMRRLGAGCRVPVSALAHIEGGELHIRGSIIDPVTRQAVEGTDRAGIVEAARLGHRLADTLLQAAEREKVQVGL